MKRSEKAEEIQGRWSEFKMSGMRNQMPLRGSEGRGGLQNVDCFWRRKVNG